MKSKIKNVIVINDFDYVQGGASKVAIDTAKILSNNGINVIFFSAVTDGTKKDDNIKYVTTNQKEALRDKLFIRGVVNGLYNIKAKKELGKLLDNYSNEDTVIHIHGFTKALSSSVFSIAYKKNFKIYLTLHDYFSACPNGGFYNYKKNCICKYKGNSIKCVCEDCDSRSYFFKIYRILRFFIQNKLVKINKKVECAIGISNLNIEILKENFNKVCRVNNPIDIGEIQKKEHINDNEYYLYLGRVSKEKGVDIFCKVITELNFKGIVVGDGSELERLKKEYSNINFVGWKNNDEVKQYISGARGLIFPSLWYEGAPLTPLEVMSQGIPCAISDKCSAKEYIENGNGVLIDTDNIEDIKQKILLMDSNLENMGKQAYDYCKEFIKQDYCKELIKVYNDN